MSKKIFILGDANDARVHEYNLKKEGNDAVILFKFEQIAGLGSNDAELHLLFGHQKNQDFAKIFDYAREHNIKTERLG